MRHVVESISLPRGPGLTYVEQGPRSGIPVLLLHGYTDCWRSYETLLEHLPRSQWAIALSQRGHGESGKPESGYEAAVLAADVAGFMDVLNIPQAIIVGHSMGSMAAQRFALDHPDRTRGLVLIGAFATMADNPAIAELAAAVAGLSDPVDPHFVLEFQKSTVAGPVPSDFLQAMVDASLQVPARVWRAALQAQMQFDLRSRLGEVTAPTLILWGDRDAIAGRRDQDIIVDSIPNAELLVYEGVGHDPHWEQPQRVAGDIAAFISDLEAQAP